MNIALLLETKQAILDHPESYEQDHFCGSKHCIAGFVVSVGDPELFRFAQQTRNDGAIYVRSRTLLSMDNMDFEEMTDPACCWPDPLRLQYESANTDAERAKAAAAAIDYYITKSR